MWERVQECKMCVMIVRFRVEVTKNNAKRAFKMWLISMLTALDIRVKDASRTRPCCQAAAKRMDHDTNKDSPFDPIATHRF